MAASAGFAVYSANLSHHTAVYGALGAVVVFLIWVWLSNLAILLGAEFDAVLERERAIAADREPSFQLRNQPKSRQDRGFPRSGSG